MGQPRNRKKVTATYVVARGAKGRPSCQHKVSGAGARKTACGYDLTYWSRQFTDLRLEAILCKRRACRD